MKNSVKERTKGILQSLGLYENARRLWAGRPDWRIACWNSGYRLAGAPDGLPIPPTRLILLTILSREVSWFLRSGRMGRDSILHVLQRNGLSIADFDAILDFGCGCGRIMRYWKTLDGPQLRGTDYNPDLISWCRKKLNGYAEFDTNELEPPLIYEGERFDFVYTISVFTHLPESLQRAWIDELGRIIKPGGFLFMTVHGDSRLFQLDAEERERFRSGQLVVKRGSVAGTNWCAAYHPERYVRDHLAADFKVIDFVPRGSRDTDQDAYLLKKGTDG
jgi:SAM-dependent methyltransferase